MLQFITKFRLFFANLTGKIGFYPSLFAFGGLCIGFIMLYAESKGVSSFLIEHAPQLVINDADTARTLLSTFIGGIISLMVFSFSMVMILLNQASNNYSPRILPGLISNKRHQYVLGYYIATLIYCILILLSIKPTDNKYQLPGFAVLIGIILSMLVLALFIYFIHSISEAIQINKIIETIYQKAKTRLTQLINQTDEEYSKTDFPESKDWNVIKINNTGYLQTIAVDALLELCNELDCKIEILAPKGTFILKNVPIARCDKELEEEQRNHLLTCFGFSRSEIVKHNYILGFKQLTEIAIKAMSPGINDPGTAITCIDYLSELFALRLCKEDFSYIKNKDDEAVISLRTIDFKELIYFVFVPLRGYCKHDVVMLHKMLTALYFLLQTKSVINNAEEIIIDEINLILIDAKANITNKKDLKGVFTIRDKAAAYNNTDRKLVSLE
ncbi:putative membrane protein [Leeuwenhoekiella aestuarii]|uniref:Putative membrane protein n=1 Tax=Leeuwenhoekiella aestuarii TaxID=2249426 RepID=A0A4Q0NXR9_9FLAO|nr:DUF2254 domain-containing protein [Leeuwenhoekiella aestuarii]RXG15610.1 putative membrane protein [Leeuwenhoekiella aestuarii]RXG17281.1 putative membrane protein [Leeuwenhoekiella aestuarii]